MYPAVYGLGNAGLTNYGALGTGFLPDIVASVMNNLPSTLVGALTIDQASVPAVTQELMAYANGLGLKLTPLAALPPFSGYTC